MERIDLNQTSCAEAQSRNDVQQQNNHQQTAAMDNNENTTTIEESFKIISSSNTNVIIDKDLLVRLHHFYTSLESSTHIQQEDFNILLFGTRKHTYQNQNIYIESFKIIYDENILIDYISKHKDGNLQLLGFSMNFDNFDYDLQGKIKKQFQKFHYMVLKHCILQRYSGGKHKNILEKYIGLNIKSFVQNQVYGGDSEVFVQLLAYYTKVFSPYLKNEYIDTICANALLDQSENFECKITYRQDINLTVIAGQSSQFGNHFPSISESNNSSGVDECMNHVFIENNNIPYLEGWINDQLTNENSSEILKLLKEYEELEKFNSSLREELYLVEQEE
ncbi:predicted protein [Naegleria gruberi]|uniref:Predicted protein n=1 Tax=Naegleria gruberi TaxID=5762 RepID=D2VDX3_NAEGR|nr:uncharacterized protein NAEGRDRAFT_67074 [Naegleria gruberi]EFC44976.1 predicted protein [Naegleria gruberi]|eukprot:XP_002677720.1 predicted protein [Naegleria gruberi strain NEG-M]